MLPVKNVECVCPRCGVIYEKLVEVEHLNSPYAWRRAGYPVIICKECKGERRIP